jgi:hypothetical protein
MIIQRLLQGNLPSDYWLGRNLLPVLDCH